MDLSVNQVDVAKLAVQRGEVLMVRVARTINTELCRRIHHAFKEAFQKGGGIVPPILIVDDTVVEVTAVKAEGPLELK